MALGEGTVTVAFHGAHQPTRFRVECYQSRFICSSVTLRVSCHNGSSARHLPKHIFPSLPLHPARSTTARAVQHHFSKLYALDMPNPLLYELIVPILRRALDSQIAILKEAVLFCAENGVDDGTMMASRLVPDMFVCSILLKTFSTFPTKLRPVLHILTTLLNSHCHSTFVSVPL